MAVRLHGVDGVVLCDLWACVVRFIMFLISSRKNYSTYFERKSRCLLGYLDDFNLVRRFLRECQMRVSIKEFDFSNASIYLYCDLQCRNWVVSGAI